jgi:hypothetical protein
MVADLVAKPARAFVRHAASSGPSRKPARLEHDDPPAAGQAGIEQSRRHTRGLARTGWSTDNHGRMLPQRIDHLGKDRINR